MIRLPFITDSILKELDSYLDSDLHRILGKEDVEDLLVEATGLKTHQAAYALRYWNENRNR